MTRAHAIAAATTAATEAGAAFVVYRFAAWPADCYGAIAVAHGLPPEAERGEVVDPTAPPAPAPTVPQRGLFD